MTISTNSWVYWWASLPDRIIGRVFYAPRSLCVLFWWCVLLVPVMLTVIALFGPFVWLVGHIIEGYEGSKVEGPISLLTTYAKAAKQKVCPIITWRDDEQHKQPGSESIQDSVQSWLP